MTASVEVARDSLLLRDRQTIKLVAAAILPQPTNGTADKRPGSSLGLLDQRAAKMTSLPIGCFGEAAPTTLKLRNHVGQLPVVSISKPVPACVPAIFTPEASARRVLEQPSCQS